MVSKQKFLKRHQEFGQKILQKYFGNKCIFDKYEVKILWEISFTHAFQIIVLSSLSIFLLQQLVLLSRTKHHVRGAKPYRWLLIAQELQVDQTIITGTTPRLKLAIANGTFEATFVHLKEFMQNILKFTREFLALDLVLEHINPSAANMAEFLCWTRAEIHAAIVGINWVFFWDKSKGYWGD